MNEIKQSLIDEIIKNNTDKPETLGEDIETIDFKEKNGSIIIDRSYQRNFIQKNNEASAYVESVFLGLIIPEIQVYENYEDGCREIVDGQQRVLSLLKFYRNEYPLSGLKYLSKLNGMYYNDLPNQLKIIFKKYFVKMRVSRNPDSEYKFLMFERLNLGTKQLSTQEIRNCIFRDSEMLKLAKRLSLNPKVEKVLDKVVSGNNRFERDEIILNILSLSVIKTAPSTKMKARIDKLLNECSNMDEKNIEIIERDFIRVASVLLEYFSGNTRNILQTRKGYIESIYVSLLLLEDINAIANNARIIENEIIKTINSEEYQESLSKATVQVSEKCFDRINLISKKIKHVIDIYGGGEEIYDI